jgi:hypothetical protein
MRDIGRTELLRGIGSPNGSLAEVRAAVAKRQVEAPPVWDPRAVVARAGDDARARHVFEADRLLNREVDFLGHRAGRSELYGLHYLTWLEPLVLAHLHTGDTRYARCFTRHFDDWFASRNLVAGQWPGLDVVWYSLGVWARAKLLVPALGVFADEPAVPDATFASGLATLLGGARWAAEEHDRYRPGNWQLVSAAELLHVASLFPDAPERSHWVAVGGARSVEHLQDDFRADGGHRERSPGYHVLCLDALQRAAVVSARDHGLDLAGHPAFARAHQWLAAMRTPGGWVPPWQDSSLVWPAELLARGRELWDVEDIPEAPPAEDSLLADSGYVVLRGSGPAAACCAVNAGEHVGHELESHSHAAVGDFVLSAWGEPLALEAGGPPDYDDPLYQGWYRSTPAHNMLSIDGRTLAEDRTIVLELDRLATPVRRVRVSHDGFGELVTRSIHFVDADPCYWLIIDELEAERPCVWSILAASPWVRVDGGFRADRRRTSLTVVAPDARLRPEIETGTGLVPGPGAGSYETLHALRLRGTTSRVAVLVAPGQADDGRVWSVRRQGTGWQVSDGHVADLLLPDSWERTTLGGAA